MKMIPACILCFVVGGIFGNLLPSGNRAQEEGGAMDSERLIGSGNTRRGIGSDLGSLNGSVREEFPLASGLPDPPESKDLMVVSKELINQLSLAAGTRSAGLSLFSKDGKLEESLQIADREKAEIQTAWRESLQKIRDLEAASSTAVDLDDGSVRITVPVLAIEMGDVGELFQSSVKSSLGENRGDVFLAMKQIDRIFERTFHRRLE